MSVPSIRVVLVESEYEINLGYIARTMANFGVHELVLLRPRISIGCTAQMFAKHAAPILTNAKIVATWEDAVAGCDLVVGTTARPFTTIGIDECCERIGTAHARVALVLGRDGSGLRNDEMEKCDMLVTIATDPTYAALNISHALAILLYEMTKPRWCYRYKKTLAPADHVRHLYSLVESATTRLAQRGAIRQPRTVITTFTRVFGRAVIEKDEVGALTIFFKRVDELLDEKGNRTEKRARKKRRGKRR